MTTQTRFRLAEFLRWHCLGSIALITVAPVVFCDEFAEEASQA